MPPRPSPQRARRGLFVVRAKVVPDRMIRRRSIRMIRGAARARHVPRNRGLTVLAAPADTDYTIRLETLAPAWRTADLGVEELTGRDIVACLAAAR